MMDVIIVNQSEFEGDQLGVLILRTTIFAHQQPNVGYEMICFIVLDVFVVLYLGVVPFLVSSYAHDFSLVLSF